MAATAIKNGFHGGSDDQLLVNPDGSINVNGGGSSGSNASVGATGSSAPASGTAVAGVNPEGMLTPIATDDAGHVFVNGSFSGGNLDTVESGTVATSFGDITGVPSSALTTLTSYVAAGPTRVKFVEVSGTNIATYTVLVNGAIINKKQTFYGYLDNDFQFSKGFQLSASDIVSVQVVHNQSSVGEFSAFILVLKDY